MDVFRALTERIPEWWTCDFQGSSSRLDDEFTVRFGPTFKTMRIAKVDIPLSVAWLCVAQRIVMPDGLAPLRDDAEWVGQTIRWTIRPDGKGAVLTLFHEGLSPESECWVVCEPGWDQTLQSLGLLFETGTGRPFAALDSEHLALAKSAHRSS